MAGAPSPAETIAYQEAELRRFRALAPGLIRAGVITEAASAAEEAVLESILATLCAAQAIPSRSSFSDLMHSLHACIDALDDLEIGLAAPNLARAQWLSPA